VPFVDVIIDGSGPHLDRFFTYSVPAELLSELALGQYLRVPWGKREKGAFLFAFRDSLPEGLSSEEVKDIRSIVDSRPVLDDLHRELANWLRVFYYGTWPLAVRCLLPGPVIQGLRRRTKSRVEVDTGEGPGHPVGPSFTPEQQAVWERLSPALGKEGTFLLHGVTGSGKTELYLRSTAEVLSQQKTALVLVPEVALTPQTQSRYRERFGSDVSILHSGLTGAQRREQWWRIRDGAARVVVGTRSAIFAPLKNCGLIVIDEEHDSSYKQSSDIRYHARQVAAWLSQKAGATVLLGSATPSLESFILAQSGRYHLLEMKNRVAGRALPSIELIKGDGIPHQVLTAMEECRAAGCQSVVLLNRRGFSNYLQCRDCGWVPECRSCSISLTYHKRDRSMRCHYCGYQQGAPAACPDCGGRHLEYPGRGTERVEQELAERLPELRVFRLDRDTVKGKSSVFVEAFKSFREGTTDCLLGTQMVAKGLDFPKVTLVVVLQADTGLHLPDFRAAERTFALLTQVAGRGGRGEEPGRVMLVCREPDHSMFTDLQSYRWKDFMLEESEQRKQFSYPPYSRMLRLLLTDEKEERLESSCEKLAHCLQQVAPALGVEVMGPAPCPIERLQGRFRWHVLLRAAKVQDLQRIVRNSLSNLALGNTRLSYDPDPLELL